MLVPLTGVDPDHSCRAGAVARLIVLDGDEWSQAVRGEHQPSYCDHDNGFPLESSLGLVRQTARAETEG